MKEYNTVIRIPSSSTGMKKPGYIHDMFKPSLCRYSTRSQMAMNIPLRKTNTGQKSLSFLGPKVWSKIGSSIKNQKC